MMSSVLDKRPSNNDIIESGPIFVVRSLVYGCTNHVEFSGRFQYGIYYETTVRGTSLNKTYPHYATYPLLIITTHASIYYHAIRNKKHHKQFYKLTKITKQYTHYETTTRSISLNKTYHHYTTYSHPLKMTHASTYWHVMKTNHIKIYELPHITKFIHII